MKRLDPTHLLPGLCFGGCVTTLVWVVASGAAQAPALWLGGALALMLIFGLIWVAGLRYPDVGWMVVTTSLLALDMLAAPSGPWTRADLILTATTKMALLMAFGSFLLAFFRTPVRTGTLEIGFAAAVALVFSALAALPLETELLLRLNGTVENYFGAVLLGYVAVQGVAALSPLPAKRQRYVVFVVLVTVAALCSYLVHARVDLATALNQTPRINAAFVCLLALCLLADLVVFHRDYLKTKTERAAERPAEAQRAARSELGRAFHQLLLPPLGPGRFGDFERECCFEPAATLGGDWLFFWEKGDELRLLVGKVTGAGAQAALGYAAVIGFLHEARAGQLPLVEALQLLNKRLLEVFQRQVTTTVQVVSLGLDGSVELFNCGGAGFFTVSAEGGRHYALSSTPLGISSAAEIGRSAVPLGHLDILFAATDGLIDGAAGTRRILDFFDDEVDLTLDFATVRDQILSLGAGAPGFSDRTLLVVQRRFTEAGVKRA